MKPRRSLSDAAKQAFASGSLADASAGHLSTPIPKAQVAPAPIGISEKDVPEIEFTFALLSEHPLAQKRIWIKTDSHGIITYKMSIHTMREYLNSGRMKMQGIADPVLPHPVVTGDMIIHARDFEPGFVMDDTTNEIKHWKIRCKKTGVYLIMENF